MAVRKGKSPAGGIASHGMEGRAPNRIAPAIAPPARGEYTFAFHDRDEIGPVMVGKVAKKTGLTPEDL